MAAGLILLIWCQCCRGSPIKKGRARGEQSWPGRARIGRPCLRGRGPESVSRLARLDSGSRRSLGPRWHGVGGTPRASVPDRQSGTEIGGGGPRDHQYDWTQGPYPARTRPGPFPGSRVPGLAVRARPGAATAAPRTGVPATAGTHYPSLATVVRPGETPPDPLPPGKLWPPPDDFGPIVDPFGHFGLAGSSLPPAKAFLVPGETPRTPTPRRYGPLWHPQGGTTPPP